MIKEEIDLSKTLSRIKKVDIEVIKGDEIKKETIIIKKAALGQWKMLTSSIKKLFEMLPEMLKAKGIDNPQKYIEQIEIEDLLQLIPDLLEFATDEFINVLAIGTGLDVNFIEENVGLDEAIELAEAIIEVNNLFQVVEKGKNLMGLWKGMPNQRK